MITSYRAGFTQNSDTIKWFWDLVINDWNDDQRKELLWFATGTKRAPLGGCVKMNPPFLIQKEDGKSPNAHTCFN